MNDVPVDARIKAKVNVYQRLINKRGSAEIQRSS